MSDETITTGVDEALTLAAAGRDDQALIDLATSAASPQALEEGATYAVAVPAGGVVRIVDRDLDRYRSRPRRKTGHVVVHDAESFVRYLGKHALPETEVWADVRSQSVVAVVNGHGGADGETQAADTVEADQAAGWGDHRVTLTLFKTDPWLAWERLDRKFLGQVQFAEHIEDRIVDVAEPDGATLLELVQTFTARRKVSFESSQRLSTGVVQVAYREEEESKAGKRGQLTFPEKIVLGIVPFEGGDPFRVTARLRYRLEDGALRLGFFLDRPADVLRTAFLDEVQKIHEGIAAPMLRGTPA